MRRDDIYRLLLPKTHRHLLTAAVALWAGQIFTTYRLPSGWGFALLPWIAAVVGLAECAAWGQDLLGPERRRYRWGMALDRAAWWLGIATRVFVYGALFLYANAKLDTSPVVDHEVLLASKAGVRRGFFGALPSELATIRMGNDATEQFSMPLIYGEARDLWGGEHVALRTRAGYFHVPWIVGIERDEAYYTKDILQLTPTAREPQKRLIQYYSNHQRWSDVVEAGRAYARLYPADHEYILWLGSTLGFAQRYEESIALLTDLAPRHPTYDVDQQLGWSLNWSGRSQEAAVVLERSIPKNPEEFEAYYHLGYVYEDMGQLEQSLHYFTKARDILGHFPEVEAKIAVLQPLVEAAHNRRARARLHATTIRQPD
ncbi:MAG: hypothetical protein U0172_02005 [Nitrospiraceae bacterium]